ncbi:MAG: TolC family protein [Candidatus Hydrogenedentes bacterium]|nr:TolC family protein [Candidatus Hydrogenedentota bacterium]
MLQRSLSLILALCLTLACAGSALAQDPPAPADTPEAPQVEEAEPAPEAAPELQLGLDLQFGEELATKSDRSLQEEISIDLIDLQALQDAINASQPREQLRLSLEECIQLALVQNPDIKITSLEPVKAEEDIFSAKGEFDPVFGAEATYTHASQSANQQAVAFGGITAIKQWVTRTQGTLSGKLHYGSQYNVIWSSNKEESTYSGFIEEFDSVVTLQLTQPLLRGFGKKYNRVRITAAENAKALTAEQLRLTVLNTVANVVKAYWDLAGAVENVRVREESLANARRLLNVNETRRRIGTAADIEVLQAKAGVATRQSDLVSARSSVSDAGDFLKTLLDLKDGDFFSNADIFPVDRPNLTDSFHIKPDTIGVRLQEAIDRALEMRPEIRISEIEIANAELEEFRTRRDLLPVFDINGSYTQGGRDHKLAKTLEGVSDRQDSAFSYGFQASIPLRNRSARGAYTKAKLDVRQAELREQQREMELIANVHQTVRNVLTNQILVESNRQSVRLQEANVVAEEKRLRLGVTTSFQVLQIQEDLTIAQTQELQAGIAYEKALVDLQLAEGTLLDNLGLQLTEPEGEERPTFVEGLIPRWKE